MSTAKTRITGKLKYEAIKWVIETRIAETNLKEALELKDICR